MVVYVSEQFWSKNQGYQRIKQGLDRKRTKNEIWKDTSIENNTVALPQLRINLIHSKTYKDINII